MALIVCPECGTLISENANVCPKCGLPMTEIPAENNTQPAKHSRKWIVWVVLACIVVAGSVIAATIIFSPSAEKCYEKGMTKTSEHLPQMIYFELLGKTYGDGFSAINKNSGLHGIRPGTEELEWFEKGGEKGDGRRDLMAGCMYYYGYGTPKDRYRASLCFCVAGDENVMIGKVLYAMMLTIDPETYYISEENDRYNIAGRMIKEAADANCPEACYYIAAAMVKSGNIAEGATYLKRATDQGIEDVMKLHVLTEPRNTPPPIYSAGVTW